MTARKLVASTIAMLIVAAPAGAATGLGGRDPMKVVAHVRIRDKHNAFHLRERVGGPFWLGSPYCEQKVPGKPLECRYKALQRASTAGGQRNECVVLVRLSRINARHTRWRRSIEACAPGNYYLPGS